MTGKLLGMGSMRCRVNVWNYRLVRVVGFTQFSRATKQPSIPHIDCGSNFCTHSSAPEKSIGAPRSSTRLLVSCGPCHALPQRP